MAIDLEDEYPGQVGPASAAWPYGEPRNVSSPGAGDGTPWEEKLCKDYFGWVWKAMEQDGRAFSGDPDTAQVSQFLESILSLMLTPDDLAKNGGTILESTDRATPEFQYGLRATWDSSTLFTTHPGTWRNLLDTTDLILPADMQKDVSQTWALGTLNGCLAPGADFSSPGWYRRFIVKRPSDGQTDIMLDTSPVAHNFFESTEAILGGFDDNTLYRRYGWVYLEAGGIMRKWLQMSECPGEYLWDVPVSSMDDQGGGNPGSSARKPYTITYVPPWCETRATFFMNSSSQTAGVLVTEEYQTDVACGDQVFTLYALGGEDENTVWGEWLVNEDQEIYARASHNTISGWTCIVHGWIDHGVSP